MQSTAPGKEKKPAAHGTHADARVAPLVAKYVPASQLAQAMVPYCPAEQVFPMTQAADPWSEYWPAGQLVQADAAGNEYAFAPQGTHFTAGLTLAYVPGAQSLHDLEATNSAAMVPAGQIRHALDPTVEEKVPIAQPKHEPEAVRE